jgi:hypothetical protein
LFEILLAIETLLCLLLVFGVVQVLSEIAVTPEVDLGQRAWVAARFSMAEASALGPLFRHLVRASRHGLRHAHVIQERVRTERSSRRHPRVLAPVLSLWERRRTQRSAELAELSHLVEQLELMGNAVARYRAGMGGLMALKVPLSCVQARISSRHPELRS